MSERAPRAGHLVDLLPVLPQGRIDNVLYRAQTGLRADALSAPAFAEILSTVSGPLLFPSHFFESEARDEFLSLLAKKNREFWVQLSPGAELRDYFQLAQDWRACVGVVFRGLELVLDRAPHEGDWSRLEALQVLGLETRFVFCPVVDLNPLRELEKMPARVVEELSFYFPPKRERRDSFLSADEIFVLLAKIHQRYPEWEPKVQSYREIGVDPLGEASLDRRYRVSPGPENFAKNFPLLGRHSRLRSLVQRMARNSLTAPLVLLPYGLVWLLHDPITLLLMPKRYLEVPRILAHKTRDLTVTLYFTTRHLLIMGFVYLRRLFSLAVIGIFFLRHCLIFTSHLLRSPFWAMKEYLPLLYWAIGFPLQKVYWFTKFQIQKRLFRRSYGET